MTKTNKSIHAARERLWAAIDRACRARGEAQWHHGYRSARFKDIGGTAEYEQMYAKEQAMWRRCGVVEKTAERAIRAYGLSIRRSYDPIRQRGTKKAQASRA